MSNRSVTQATFHSLIRNPFFLFAIQLPQGLLDLLEHYISSRYGDTNHLVTGLYALSAFVVGVVPQVLTFTAISLQLKQEAPSLSRCFSLLQSKWGALVMSSFILGALFSVGIMAYVIPGLFLMSLYLFVPLLIVEEPSTKLSNYFYRSTRLAKKNLGKCFGFILVVLAIFLASQKLAETFGERLSLLSTQESVGVVLWGLPVALISMLVNALVNTWLSHFFLALREKEKQ